MVEPLPNCAEGSGDLGFRGFFDGEGPVGNGARVLLTVRCADAPLDIVDHPVSVGVVCHQYRENRFDEAAVSEKSAFRGGRQGRWFIHHGSPSSGNRSSDRSRR